MHVLSQSGERHRQWQAGIDVEPAARARDEDVLGVFVVVASQAIRRIRFLGQWLPEYNLAKAGLIRQPNGATRVHVTKSQSGMVGKDCDMKPASVRSSGR